MNNNPNNYDFNESEVNSKDPMKKKAKVSAINLIKNKRFLYIIIFSILGLLLIGAAIGIIIFFTRKKPPTNLLDNNNDDEKELDSTIHEKSTTNQEIKNLLEEYGKLEMQTEYKLETNVGELKSIYINQRYYEDIKIDGILSQNIVDRKTNYHIYVLDEIPANDDEILFYNKTYLCAISISSECVSTQDEYCLPKKLVDFNNQDYSHVSRLRHLDELQNLENIPLPLCLFN